MSSSFTPRAVLVTGGAGFIGSNFINHFMTGNADCRLVNLDALTYAGNLENLRGVENKPAYRFVKGDICDGELVASLLREGKIDAVVHFAAESHVDRSIKRPAEFIFTNIVGTFNLLEAARSHADRFSLFHHVSTDEVYGTLGKEGLFTETMPYKPNSPYSASKASSDHLVRAYFKTYGLPMTISNCSNNYGPWQFPEKLIPLITLNALEGKPLPVYGDGKNVRDWLYVEDHCEAIWTIMNKGRRGETYNVGGNSEEENIAVVHEICDILDEISPRAGAGARRELIAYVKDRPGHDWRYAIDSSKLQAELKWAPRESFHTGLRKTILWYLENNSWIARVRSGEYLRWIDEHYGAEGK
jgi:dTDP-glucose 4,6-dehydratase